MTMALATRIVLVLTIATTGLCIFIICRFQSSRRLFLFDLGRELTVTDRARAQRVQILNAVFVLVGAVGALWAEDPDIVLALTTLAPLVPVFWMIGEMIAAVRSIDRIPLPGRFTAPLDRPLPVWEYVLAPLQAINVATVAAGTAVVAWLVDRLPESVPVHWNAVGEPDRWGSPSEHWVVLPTLLFTTGMLWILMVMIARERWVLPPEEPERYDELQRRRRTMSAYTLQWIIVGSNVGLAVMWVLLAANGLPTWRSATTIGMVVGIALIGIATVGTLAFFTPKLLRVAEEIRELAGTQALGTHEDGWRWGGLIYYAPNDPALLVPKRLGIGQTINFARPSAWIFILSVVVAPIALVLFL